MTVHVFPKKIWGHHAVIERVRHFIHRMVETLDDAIDFRAIHREFKFFKFRLHHLEYRSVIASGRL